MILRKWLIAVVVALIVLGGSALSAQTFDCGGLSQDDCDILTQSMDAMAELESAAYDFNIDVTIKDLPMSPQTVTLTMAGSGGYAILDPEFLQSYAQGFSGDLPQMMENLVRALNADGDIIFTIPEDLSGPGQPNRAGMSLKLVDGFIYMNLDKMAEVMGGGMRPSGWYGFNLGEFYRVILEQQGLGFTIPNTTAPIQNMQGFVTIERQTDTTIDGQSAAVFEYTYDYSALADNEMFMDLMREQLEGMGMGGQFDIDALADFYNEMFSSINLSMTQTVGLDDFYVHDLQFSMDWDIDMDSLMALSGVNSADMGMSRFGFTMNMSAALSQFDDYPAIEAPEDVEIIPLNMLPGMPLTEGV